MPDDAAAAAGLGAAALAARFSTSYYDLSAILKLRQNSV